MRKGVVTIGPAMKRILRVLLNGVTVLSLVLCVATVALWTWSHRSHQRVRLSRPLDHYTLHSNDGRLTVTGPPPATPAEEAAARQLLTDVRNGQFYWTQAWAFNGTG